MHFLHEFEKFTIVSQSKLQIVSIQSIPSTREMRTTVYHEDIITLVKLRKLS